MSVLIKYENYKNTRYQKTLNDVHLFFSPLHKTTEFPVAFHYTFIHYTLCSEHIMFN